MRPHGLARDERIVTATLAHARDGLLVPALAALLARRPAAHVSPGKPESP